MAILRYQDINEIEEFLEQVFMESVMESSEILADTYLSKLDIHKGILDKYKNILPKLNKITTDLIKNSGLKIDLNKFNVTLFSLASLSNSLLINGEYTSNKSEYEKELRSILEELKLNGIGNNLVQNLSKFYDKIIDISRNVFKTKDIHDCLESKNLLEAVDDYIKRNKISFDTFISKVEKLSALISKYVKSGKLNDFRNKLSKKTGNEDTSKVLTINELNK